MLMNYDRLCGPIVAFERILDLQLNSFNIATLFV